LKNYKKSNEILHGLFTNIKFLYEKTDNTYLDKYFCIYKVQYYYNFSTIKILIDNLFFKKYLLIFEGKKHFLNMI
jgi:hypothetical protein